MIIADYHTHTKFSHGKNTIEENVQQAREIGLKQIAITDHGLNHVAFGLSPKKVATMRKIVDGLNQAQNDVKVLLGVEANIVSRDGDIDILPDRFSWFDIIVCGYHKVVFGKNLTETIKFIAKNDILQVLKKADNKKLVEKNTEILCKAVRKNPIDIMSHPNHDMVIDAVALAKVMKECGTYFELNAKKVHIDNDTLREVAKTGVEFIIDSDAHTASRVGDFKLSFDIAESVGIPKSQIVNWDRLPEFRSQIEREKNKNLGKLI
ncbi:MAG: PHP domain-containing protein [Clostridia bacterium]